MMSGNAVIVLGRKETSDDPEDYELKGRIRIGIEVLQRDDGDYLILSGGKTSSRIPECEIMAKYAIGLGADSARIVKECHSLDTIGNGYFTRKLIDSLKNVKSVCVVSSCYHMPRVKYVFEMCFGNDKKLDFNHCFEFGFSQDSEKRKMEITRKFFDGVTAGDIDEIKARIYSKHNLYNTSLTSNS
jgi:hypothetical protein